ncbi:aspartyl-tRNA(Asn)/glutamyl-tRNA(Gln) amidotransferase subunit A [Erwinia persicina]|uniref:amidase n=1 Tax=Erwinia persicina TaxID=55211 RepID=UPI00209CD700|nr:amidase [Erwinia persicina]MCP1437242.1 aspartyl-tRNA(Asn)/glutamyl-tRNA(Gln) amidotransferase subunit A [Erwinia persicina]
MTTLWQASQQLQAGNVQPETFTQAALAAARDPEKEGARVFITRYEAQAKQQAIEAGERWQARQSRSPIDGLPISIKDLFDVKGEATTAGSRLLSDAPVATANASVVEKLNRAGAAIVGKTNMTEFAFSGLGINPHYGTPANPWRREEKRIPGGSSSGAAVAVADGLCLGAIGTDTGGSVRIPAALCGLTGFKPGASRIDQAGTLPLAPSLDSIGVIAHDVRSCWLLDSIIAEKPLEMRESDLRHARFAVPQTRVLDDLDRDVAQAWQYALDLLREAGATLVALPLTELDELNTLNARGGITAYEAWQWHQRTALARPEAYDPQVLMRLQRGSQLTEQDAAELYQQRAAWQRRINTALEGFDALLMPTVPKIAPTIASLDEPQRYMEINALMLRNTSVINMLDGCAISLPCHPAGHAPVGLSLAAVHGDDARLISWAVAVETALTRRS